MSRPTFAAIGARRPARVHRAATAVAHAALDLQQRHRPVGEVDRDRLRLWARQTAVDAAAGAAFGATLADLRAAAATRDLTRASTIATTLATPPP